MKKQMKDRVLSMLMAFVMIIGLVPATALPVFAGSENNRILIVTEAGVVNLTESVADATLSDGYNDTTDPTYTYDKDTQTLTFTGSGEIKGSVDLTAVKEQNSEESQLNGIDGGMDNNSGVAMTNQGYSAMAIQTVGDIGTIVIEEGVTITVTNTTDMYKQCWEDNN